VFRDQNLKSAATSDPIANFDEKPTEPGEIDLTTPPPAKRIERALRDQKPIEPTTTDTDKFLDEVFGTADAPKGDLMADGPEFPSLKQMSKQVEPNEPETEAPEPSSELTMDELFGSATASEDLDEDEAPIEEEPEEADTEPEPAYQARRYTSPPMEEPDFPQSHPPFAPEDSDEPADKTEEEPEAPRVTRSPLRLRLRNQPLETEPPDEEEEAADLDALDALDEAPAEPQEDPLGELDDEPRRPQDKD